MTNTDGLYVLLKASDCIVSTCNPLTMCCGCFKRNGKGGLYFECFGK